MRIFLLIVSFLIMAGLFIKIDRADRELISKTGYGMGALQSAQSVKKAQVVIDSWKGELKEAVKQTLFLDFGFMIFGYGFFMVSIGFVLKSMTLSMAPLLAVIFDFLENVLQLEAISMLNYTLIPIASIFSAFKFAFMILFAIVLCYVLFAKFIMKRMQHI